MNPRASEPNPLTTVNKFHPNLIFCIAQWLTLQDAISFLTTNKNFNAILKQDFFWNEKVGALNFVDFFTRLNQLTSEALKSSLLNSRIKIFDAEITQILLDADKEVRCACYFESGKEYPFFDSCVIAIGENLITPEQLKTNSTIPYLLNHDFVFKALRDKLISVNNLLNIREHTITHNAITKRVFFEIIVPVLKQLIKEKLGPGFTIAKGLSSTHDKQYVINAPLQSEVVIDHLCKQFIQFGIEAEKRDKYFIYLSETTAHNLRLTLQKMPVLEYPATPELTNINAHSLFAKNKTTVAVNSPTAPTLRPKKPTRV
ncbi:MAG TPA: hypothetical protein VFU82_01670 [Gammaproteobacteria bacterium]|jgi:hypothetical protein|nr:hypothetical protein [Gammaproteobacteria bacterium]